MKKTLTGKKVYLIAATLRPETMYGQTSCFLLPSGEYCAIEMKNNEVFICSERSALNMAYQDLTK
jgi:leucyl-tRNA synthetase